MKEKKIVKAYTLEPAVIAWVEEQATKQERSSSYIVNKTLKEKINESKVPGRKL